MGGLTSRSGMTCSGPGDPWLYNSRFKDGSRAVVCVQVAGLWVEHGLQSRTVRDGRCAGLRARCHIVNKAFQHNRRRIIRQSHAMQPVPFEQTFNSGLHQQQSHQESDKTV